MRSPVQVGRTIDVPASGEVGAINVQLPADECAIYSLTLMSLPLPRVGGTPASSTPRPNPSLRARIEVGAGDANAVFHVDFPRGTVLALPGNSFRVQVRSLDGTTGKAFVGFGFDSPGGQLSPPQLTTDLGAIASGDDAAVELGAFAASVIVYREPATTALLINFRGENNQMLGQVIVPSNEQQGPLLIPTGTRRVQVVASGAATNATRVLEILQ